jgi:hypothetical protein
VESALPLNAATDVAAAPDTTAITAAASTALPADQVNQALQ